MEYVDGSTLSSVLRNGPIAPQRAAAIAADVAAALDFAHRRGVIHRDVKPGNVLIDLHGQVKVADFGIARAAGSSEDLTQTGSVMGTATYFSPEQAQGSPSMHAATSTRSESCSTRWSRARPPFSGDSPVSIAYKHVKEQPVPPTTTNIAVPATLEAIILKAMAKDPADRYQTADEMRADLLRFINGQPVEAFAMTQTIAAVGGLGAAGVVGDTAWGRLHSGPAYSRGSPTPPRRRVGAAGLPPPSTSPADRGGGSGRWWRCSSRPWRSGASSWAATTGCWRLVGQDAYGPTRSSSTSLSLLRRPSLRGWGSPR